MVKEVNVYIASLLEKYYAKELVANNAAALINRALRDYLGENKEAGEEVKKAWFKLEQSLNRRYGSNCVFTLLYLFFLDNLNLNILKLELDPPNAYGGKCARLYGDLLVELSDNADTITINVPKTLNYKVKFESIGISKPVNIYFDNSMTSMPGDIFFIDATSRLSNSAMINIYLPDNLSGVFNPCLIAKGIISWIKDPDIARGRATNAAERYPVRFYFKPVDRSGELGSKFELRPIHKKSFLGLFAVKE